MFNRRQLNAFKAAIIAGSVIAAVPSPVAALGIDFPIADHPLSTTRSAVEGDSVEIDIRWTTPADKVTDGVQWYHNGNPIEGATQPTLRLENIRVDQSGNFFVRSTTAESNWVTINVRSAGSSPVDRNFVSNLPADGSVYRVVGESTQGEIYVEALTEDSNRLYRLSNRGQIDSTFEISIADPLFAYELLAILNNGDVLANLVFGGVATRTSRISTSGVENPIAPTIPTVDAIATLPIGHHLIATHAPRSNGSDDQVYRILRLNGSGELISGGGFREINRNGTLSQISARRDGSFLVVSHDASRAPSRRWRIEQFDASGNLNSGFHVIENSAPMVVVGVLPDNRILVGVDPTDLGTYHTLRRFFDDGTRDPTFPTVFSQQRFSAPHAFLNDQGELFILGNFWTQDNFNVDQTFTEPKRIDPDNFLGFDPSFYLNNDFGELSYTAFDGRWLYATGRFSHYDGHITSRVVRLDTHFSNPPPSPSVDVTVGNPTASGVSIVSRVSSDLPVTYRWFPLDGQQAPEQTTAPSLVFPSLNPSYQGRWQLEVTNESGRTLSGVVTAPQPFTESSPRIINLSGRVWSGAGVNAATAGFVLADNRKPGVPHLLMRGIGPALTNLGVTSAVVSDPEIQIFSATGDALFSNDDWAAPLDEVANRVGAFQLTPSTLDAALYSNLPIGGHTITLKSKSNSAGIGLIEIYNVDRGYKLQNLSLRGFVGSGAQALIGGFVIDDLAGTNNQATILLRAVGPTLRDFGLPNALNDPQLEIFNSDGKSIAKVQDWANIHSAEETAQVSQKVGAFPLPEENGDAAIVLRLPVGVYTAHVTSEDDSTGIALFEIYQLID